jgi:hypothetical protein
VVQARGMPGVQDLVSSTDCIQ